MKIREKGDTGACDTKSGKTRNTFVSAYEQAPSPGSAARRLQCFARVAHVSLKAIHTSSIHSSLYKQEKRPIQNLPGGISDLPNPRSGQYTCHSPLKNKSFIKFHNVNCDKCNAIVTGIVCIGGDVFSVG
jgi:hypothetical protein